MRSGFDSGFLAGCAAVAFGVSFDDRNWMGILFTAVLFFAVVIYEIRKGREAAAFNKGVRDRVTHLVKLSDKLAEVSHSHQSMDASNSGVDGPSIRLVRESDSSDADKAGTPKAGV